MQDYKKLTVWEIAHKTTLEVYNATQSFPLHEIYGLTSQLRRAASSIAANIAEGCGCMSNREFSRFLQIAFRSANETEYHLLLANDLGYLEQSKYDSLCNEIAGVKRMLSSLMKKLKTEDY